MIHGTKTGRYRKFPVILFLFAVGLLPCEVHSQIAPNGTEYKTRVAKSKNPLVAPSEYRLWIPEKSKTIRVLFVINKRGVGKYLYENDQRWREMAQRTGGALLYCGFEAQGVRRNGFGASILKACEQFADQLNRKELDHVPMVLWGHSMGGRVAQDFARYSPNRVLAFHIGLRANPSKAEFMKEEPNAMKIPALYLMGEKDSTPKDIKEHFDRSRVQGSARAWILLPGQNHWPKGKIRHPQKFRKESWDLWMANDVLIPWTESIIKQRLPNTPQHDEDKEPPMIGQPVNLRSISLDDGWLGNLDTGEISPYSSKHPNKEKASWFPDRATAAAWQKYSFPNKKFHGTKKQTN